ncbi:hypothetical protein Tco_1185671 [Tanacetum coccineum]
MLSLKSTYPTLHLVKAVLADSNMPEHLQMGLKQLNATIDSMNVQSLKSLSTSNRRAASTPTPSQPVPTPTPSHVQIPTPPITSTPPSTQPPPLTQTVQSTPKH